MSLFLSMIMINIDIFAKQTAHTPSTQG